MRISCLLILILLTGCNSTNSIPKTKSVAELNYCDIVKNPSKYDGQTVVLTGTLVLVSNGSGWMNGPECQKDESSAAVFFDNEKVEDFFYRNGWQTTRQLEPRSLPVRVRARFVNRPPDKSTNQKANFQILIEEVIAATP